MDGRGQMKISFLGDGFCADIDEGSYPYLVAQALDAEIISQGKRTDAIYNTYRKLKLLPEADWYIICVPSADRLPVVHEVNYYGKNEDGSFIHNELAIGEEIVAERDVQRGIDLYYEDLVDWNYQDFMHCKILSEIDNLLENKKCIWMPSFVTSIGHCKDQPNSGVIFNDILFDMTTDDMQFNYLSIENNKVLADKIIAWIKK
jgi:hypothetical protein